MSIWVCVGSGPSLVPDDLDFVREQGWRIATCNMGFTICPDARVFHAMDSVWWEQYGDEALETLRPDCQVWTGSDDVASEGKARLVTWDGEQGYSDTVGHCHGGKLSGLQLINIVGWYQPTLVILLGYDNMARHGQQHWHQDYPDGMRNGGTVDQRDGDYSAMFRTAPFPIINCSRRTNILDSIPRMKLADAAAMAMKPVEVH